MMLKLFPKKSHGHGILADTMYLIEANPKGKHRTKVGLQLLAQRQAWFLNKNFLNMES